MSEENTNFEGSSDEKKEEQKSLPPPSDNIGNPTSDSKKTLEGDINTKNIVEEKRRINILSNEDVQKRVAARTEQEIKNPPPKQESPKTLEEYRAKINEDSKKAMNDMTPEKYHSLAKSLVAVFDILISSLLRRFALDPVDSGYSINQEKKDELASQLANILIITSTQVPVVGVFLITLIAVYITPVMNAYQHRQQALAIRAEKKKRGEPLLDFDPKTGAPKKKRGGQPKG